ncbi:alpha/beta fold hydrolase [Mycobacterium sp. CBMA271]|uniref:alpha/beta fold hydrolase n=1 Tax=unclassified Mycobacteroides TaxID=2618759 RepID=UPI0012DED941|nr:MULTISPECIES: alpha/beta fold hydrolase [unclassified Mycobacteroides]MUM19024.1 hypothetical protein [Mycobacteroides sp. CBMA 326]MUM24682.1 alpha/beta fold hydrolase [Mycobacteroides sp. CBMA 271]
MTGWNRIERGTGSPLVLLHGVGGSSRHWLPVIDQLAVDRRVIAFDFPGHGETPAPGPDVAFSMSWAVNELAAELTRLGFSTPVDIVGNSMGGWIALEAAKRGVARSVVALAPAGLWRDGVPGPTKAQIYFSVIAGAVFASPFARPVLTQAPVRAALLHNGIPRADRLPVDVVRGIFQDMYRSGPTLRSAMHYATTAHFEGGQSISVPITVAFGDLDKILPERTCQFRDPLPRHTRWVSLPGCGHMPMFDNPALIVRTILDGIGESVATSEDVP